ncbi:MAG: Uncharacterised protein [Opitutia bacterium UBA7350]|nr:MAG: Uncharacterised protein [Opitutae bacterium UBA7350]
MDWQIKTMAGKSSATSAEFKPGDVVLSLIYKDEDEGILARLDLLETEASSFQLPCIPFGRWKRIIKEAGASEINPKDQILAAEDLFFSLFEATDSKLSKEGDAEHKALKHLLALLLERKRILRAIGSRVKEGTQLYRHTKLGREFEVSVIEVYPELMKNIMETMGDVFMQS